MEAREEELHVWEFPNLPGRRFSASLNIRTGYMVLECEGADRIVMQRPNWQDIPATVDPDAPLDGEVSS